MKNHNIAAALIILCLLFPLQYILAENPVVQYMKNGDRSLYTTAQIDSITFSHYDLDSVYNSEICTQVIWHDGTFDRVLIEDIEKVSLSRPDTELQPNVYEITGDLFKNVTGVDYDNFTLNVAADCPADCIPAKGDRIYTLAMDSEFFQSGFMGEIVDIKTGNNGEILLQCDPLDYEDIFKTYYGSFNRYIYGAEQNYEVSQQEFGAKRANSEEKSTASVSLPKIEHHLSLDFITPLSIAGFESDYERDLGIEIIPTLEVSNAILVDNGRKLRNCSYDGDLAVRITENVQGSAEYEFKGTVFETSDPIPVAPLICVYLETGILADLSFEEINMSAEVTRHFKMKGSCTFDGSEIKNLKFDNNNARGELNTATLFASGKGTLDIGAFLEVGIESVAEKFWKKTNQSDEFSLGRLGAFFQGGVRFGIDATYSQDDWDNSMYNTNLYEALSQPENIKVGLFGTAGFEASLFSLSASIDKTIEAKPFYKSSILPKFTETSIEAAGSYVFKVSSPYTVGLVRPRLGFAAFDITDSTESYTLAAYDNAGLASTQNSTAVGIFDKPDENKVYRIYPYMQYNDKRILSAPYADYGDKKEPVTVESKVNDAYFILELDGNRKPMETAIIKYDLILNEVEDNCYQIDIPKTSFNNGYTSYDLNQYRDKDSNTITIPNISLDITDNRYDLSHKTPEIRDGEYIYTIPIVATLRCHANLSRSIFTEYKYIEYNVELKFRPKFSIKNVKIDKNPKAPEFSLGAYRISADFETEGLMCYYMTDNKIKLWELLEFMGVITHIKNPDVQWSTEYLEFMDWFGIEPFVPFAIVRDGHSSKADEFDLHFSASNLISSTPSTYGPTEIYLHTYKWGLGGEYHVESITKFGYWPISTNEFFPCYQYVKFDVEWTRYWIDKFSTTHSEPRLTNFEIVNSK